MRPENNKLISGDKQIMQHLDIIVIRDPVLPFLILHRLQNVGGLNLQNPFPAVLINQLPIQRSLHERILQTLQDPEFMMHDLILWIIQAEQLSDILLRLFPIDHVRLF